MIFKELELNTITKEDLLNLSYNRFNFISYMFKSGVATNGDEIKKEFGYGYIPEWHQDIVNMEDYYISPDKNDFFIAYEFY